MITLPPNFQTFLDKGQSKPAAIVYMQEDILDAEKTLQADWQANTSESNVDYTTQNGAVILMDSIWICDVVTAKIYNIENDGTLISSFATSVYDAAATAPQGVSHDTKTNTLWIIDSTTKKVYNTKNDGTLISSFLTSVYDASATIPSGISLDVDGTLWVSDANSNKVYNIQTDGTWISEFPTSTYDAGATTISDISYAPNDTLWVTDAATDKVYNITTTGTLISSFATSVYDAGSTLPTGVGYGVDGNLWITDSVTDKVYKVSTVGTLISSFASSVFDAGATGMTGDSNGKFSITGSITTDNFDLGSTPTVDGEWQISDNTLTMTDILIMVDSTTDKVYITETDGTLISSFATSVFDASATNTLGITRDKYGTLWVVDVTTNKIYNIELDGTLISSFLTSVFDVSATLSTGISYDPATNTLWICDVVTAKIYNIELDGTLISSFLTSVFDAAAILPQGISIAPDDTLWVIDSTTDKIYNIETDGTWISEFATSVFDAAATLSTGISYDSITDTLWITDANTDKIYNVTIIGTWISEFATSVFDAAATNPQGISFDTPQSLYYRAWGSATGAFAGEETDLGIIIDGTAITQLFRYYRTKTYLYSSHNRTETPKLIGIIASFSTFVKLTDALGIAPVNDYEMGLKSLSSLSSSIDDFNESKIGQINLTLDFNATISKYLFSKFPKNKIVKVFIGFDDPDFPASDFIEFFRGQIIDYNITGNDLVTITTQSFQVEWTKNVPETWESVSDDKIWISTHPTDILLDIISNYMEVRDSKIGASSFEDVKNLTPTWRVTRTITEDPESAKDLAADLRVMMNAYFIPQPDGKIVLKRFDSSEASIASLTDANMISIVYKGNLKEIKNKTIIYYGHGEDGAGAYTNPEDGDEAANFDNLAIGLDTISVDNWGETRRKEIKDKWTRSTGTSQITSFSDTLLLRYKNPPAVLDIQTDKKFLYIETGDIIDVTTDRAPSVDGISGISAKKFQVVSRMLNFQNDRMNLTVLEV